MSSFFPRYFWPMGPPQVITAETGISTAVITASYLINVMNLVSWPADNEDWPLYIASMPGGHNVKSSCAAIYNTSGVLDGRILDEGEVIQHPGIQIKVRSVDYQEGWEKINDIVEALDAVLNEKLEMESGGIYEIQNASRTSTIVSLGMEEGTGRRYLFTVNYLCTLREII